MSSLTLKPSFLAEEEKEISQPQTEIVVGLETEKDLKDERTRRASALSLFSLNLFSSIQVWMSKKVLQTDCSMEGQRLRADYSSRKIETQ